MQYAFRPIGIILGIVSGLGAKKLFDFVWGKFDDEEAPNPEHRDINWTKFMTSGLYPQIVYQRDLGGVPLTSGQAAALGNAAINACDAVGDRHLGYIPDPFQCRYDPTHRPPHPGCSCGVYAIGGSSGNGVQVRVADIRAGRSCR